ncbi:hypothetical protein M0Q97_05365 [Candidatus Dojkabacteria bacterium]|jgi:hypothetical protein|nr:hypothetical protein [Candidatus Dojkabacteria bacterium]
MKYLKFFEQKIILNQSFGYTMNDINELIDFLKDEYKNLPDDVLNDYLNDIKKTCNFNNNNTIFV